MKILMKLFVSSVLCGALCGCELLCQAGTGTCGMSREEAHRLLNPKPYGTRWIKENGTDEQRLLDIAECGGVGTHVGFTHEQIRSFYLLYPDDNRAFFQLLAAWGKCMALKGYRFQ